MESPEVVLIQFLMEQNQRLTQTVQNLSESLLKLQANQLVSYSTDNQPEVYQEEETAEEVIIGFESIDLGDLEFAAEADLQDIDA